MARPSPGTQRVVAILNLLASNPGKRFSLTDLIIGLQMNRATCHSLANELVAAGYLYRTRDKHYLLGPAAAQLGRAAAGHASPLEIALPEMEAVASANGVACSAIFRDGADVVVRQRVLSSAQVDWSGNREVRWPLRPPFGGVFLAWSSKREVDAWFESLDPRPSPSERQRTLEGMTAVRQHGFQFVVRLAPDPGDEDNLDWLFVQDLAQRPLEIGTSLHLDGMYQLGGMSAPVFEAPGRVAFALSLTRFSRAYSGAQVMAIGQELRAACDRISEYAQQRAAA